MLLALDDEFRKKLSFCSDNQPHESKASIKKKKK